MRIVHNLPVLSAEEILKIAKSLPRDDSLHGFMETLKKENPALLSFLAGVSSDISESRKIIEQPPPLVEFIFRSVLITTILFNQWFDGKIVISTGEESQ